MRPERAPPGDRAGRRRPRPGRGGRCCRPASTPSRSPSAGSATSGPASTRRRPSCSTAAPTPRPASSPSGPWVDVIEIDAGCVGVARGAGVAAATGASRGSPARPTRPGCGWRSTDADSVVPDALAHPPARASRTRASTRSSAPSDPDEHDLGAALLDPVALPAPARSRTTRTSTAPTSGSASPPTSPSAGSPRSGSTRTPSSSAALRSAGHVRRGRPTTCRCARRAGCADARPRASRHTCSVSRPTSRRAHPQRGPVSDT